MQTLPQDIGNRALDAIGHPTPIGSISDGTRESEAFRRQYRPSVTRLLRAAHWNFARKSAALLLLADASGNTLDPITNLPISAAVEQPWVYAYAWPIDGIAARWMPYNQGPLAIPPDNTSVTPPGFANNATVGYGVPQIPGRFLVSSSDQFPAVVGQTDWDNLPDLDNIQGQGLISRRVILTNIPQANFVYTRFVDQIDEWDPLFQEAVVADLASRMALPVAADRKEAMALRSQQVALAKEAVREARTANANDAGFPQTVNHIPDWITQRTRGGYGARWGYGDGPGYTYRGWEACGWADGSVF